VASTLVEKVVWEKVIRGHTTCVDTGGFVTFLRLTLLADENAAGQVDWDGMLSSPKSILRAASEMKKAGSGRDLGSVLRGSKRRQFKQKRFTE
jgi:hypothetical protein